MFRIYFMAAFIIILVCVYATIIYNYEQNTKEKKYIVKLNDGKCIYTINYEPYGVTWTVCYREEAPAFCETICKMIIEDLKNMGIEAEMILK